MTIWEELDRRAAEAPAIGDLFEADLARAERFSARAGDFLFDYSKTAIDAGTRDLLLRLAAGTGVAERRAAMFAGEKINETEGRAVLHTALRALEGPIRMDGEDVLPDIRATRARMAAFAGDVRDGRFRAAGGAVTDVVNIGIGGSDLGPAMACTAFADIADGPRTHFLSNIDGAHAGEIMRACPPETTLVIVASKTFTTVETMTNAATLRDWMAAHVPDPAAQMVAVSSAADRAADWGIPADRVFGFGDYVGGRYSMWGPIGLPIMLAIGPQRFEAFLAGAAAMDAHFREAPFEANLPVLLALTGIWHRQVLGHPTRAVLPYDQRLARLPAYLQQLEMESNGKRVTMTGGAPARPTGPVVWGEPGTNGQHAFFQLIHQGTDVIPCEFLVVARGGDPALDHHHRLLIANCLAQSRALMVGRVRNWSVRRRTASSPATAPR